MDTKHRTAGEHILDVGRSLVGTQGFTALGLTQLLKVADVPKGSFYHYFASKEAFGCSLLQQYLAEYSEQLDAILNAEGKPARTRLMDYFSLWCSNQTSEQSKNHCLIVKLAAEVSDISDDMRSILDQGTEMITEHLMHAIEAGHQDGSILTSVPAAQTATALYQLWLGASLMTKIKRQGGPLQEAMWMTNILLPELP
ncbi:MAG: TetR/AcrR family transcriptional regulator [Sneathiella sp.]|nr:TetR/AcrR family transcriptional regulator [Sneathiella sp.]